MESQYQDEFCRACYLVLGGNVHLISEWAGRLLGGRVDFQVMPVKWAIECVREGDRLEDHIARFLPEGKYYKWIMSEEIKEYILLDFRKSKPRKVRGIVIFSIPLGRRRLIRLDNVPFLYFIVFSDDYTSYETYDAKLNLVGERMALLQ